MTSKGKPRADSKKRKQDRGKPTASKRQRIQPDPSPAEEPAERIQLSVGDMAENNNQGAATGQGNVSWPPLVENVFDISTILNEPPHTSQPSNTSNTMSFGLKFGEEMPPDIIKCADDDLSAHVPHQLKEKIWTHKYINLALLLKGTAELNDIFSGGLLHVSPDGQIEAKPKQSKETVPNIERWTDAFLIFASIYTVRYPDKVQELFKYMSIIRDASSKFPFTSCRSYDEQFRMRQAIKVMSWGHINPDLWLRIMPSAVNKSLLSQSGQSSTATNTCRFFNKGSCTYYHCNFRHACDLCGSTSHGMINCYVGKSQDTNNARPYSNFRTFRSRYPSYKRGFPVRGRGFQANNK